MPAGRGDPLGSEVGAPLVQFHTVNARGAGAERFELGYRVQDELSVPCRRLEHDIVGGPDGPVGDE